MVAARTPYRAGFKLYLAGPHEYNEALRLAVLRHLQEALGDAFELSVIDLKATPNAGQADSILATPTLLRTHPAPQRRAVGDLHNKILLAQTLLFDIT